MLLEDLSHTLKTWISSLSSWICSPPPPINQHPLPRTAAWRRFNYCPVCAHQIIPTVCPFCPFVPSHFLFPISATDDTHAVLIIRPRLFLTLIRPGWDTMGAWRYLRSPPSWIQLFLKGHSLHHLTCCPTLSSFSREPPGGPGSQRRGLSLETNMDWWADSITALLQEGGSGGEDRRVNETKWGPKKGG